VSFVLNLFFASGMGSWPLVLKSMPHTLPTFLGTVPNTPKIDHILRYRTVPNTLKIAYILRYRTYRILLKLTTFLGTVPVPVLNTPKIAYILRYCTE
jgi:hypothetical protein